MAWVRAVVFFISPCSESGKGAPGPGSPLSEDSVRSVYHGTQPRSFHRMNCSSGLPWGPRWLTSAQA